MSEGPTKNDNNGMMEEDNNNNKLKLVTPLVEYGIRQCDLETAIKVLNAVAMLNPKKQQRQQQQQQINGGKRKQQQQQQKEEKNNNNPTKKKKKKQNDNNYGEKSNTDNNDGSTQNGINNNNNNNNNNNGDEDDVKSIMMTVNNNVQNKTVLTLDEYKHGNLRLLRKALMGCFDIQKQVMYDGLSEDDYYEKRLAERTLRRQKESERCHQRKYIAETKLRKGRIDKLEQLKNNAQQEEQQKLLQYQSLLIPDGHVDTTATHTTTTPPLLTSSSTQVQVEKEKEEEDVKMLPKLRSCYVCKVRFRELHHFYDQLCPKCAKLNFAKRHFSVSLKGKVAVVTGSRVKIGYQTCLKLLRAGCIVVATTRFPNAAALAYQQETDFDNWKLNLHIIGLDLRDVTGIEAFCRFLKQQQFIHGNNNNNNNNNTGGGIDILINNACQTIRRPAQYYAPAVEKEQQIWKQQQQQQQSNDDDTPPIHSQNHKLLLHKCIQFENIRHRLHQNNNKKTDTTTDTPSPNLLTNGTTTNNIQLLLSSDNNADHNNNNNNNTNHQQLQPTHNNNNNNNINNTEKKISKQPLFESSGLTHSAAMSQLMVLPEDVGVSPDILPPNASDINGQQIDLRRTNSWLLKMHEVSTPEIMECMLVNAIAPFVLNSRLKPLMTTHSSSSSSSDDDDHRRRPDRYIINVSAMEGKFYRYKMPNHPHTNMAKAALNMLTRTSAEDLAKQNRIFMNSVDTGWINDENPLQKAHQIAKTNLFQTPIDEIDAAARILDPIFSGVAIDQQKQQQMGDNDQKEKDNNNNNNKKDVKPYGKFFKDYRETEW